jgi:hypothetical protein
MREKKKKNQATSLEEDPLLIGYLVGLYTSPSLAPSMLAKWHEKLDKNMQERQFKLSHFPGEISLSCGTHPYAWWLKRICKLKRQVNKNMRERKLNLSLS